MVTCPEPLVSGPRKGEPCGKKCAPDSERCRRHSETGGTVDKKGAFIEALRDELSIYAAAKVVGVGRATVYRWRDADPAFDAAIAASQADAIDTLEQSLFRRAKKSDTTAAIFLLKSWRPDKYRERTAVEHSGEVRTVNVEPERIAGLADELAAKRAKRAG